MKKIKSILILLVIGVIFSCAYIAFYISPNGLKIQQYQLSSNSLPEELVNMKIGFFSDLDLKSEADLKRFEKIVNRINKQNFDLILFGGDIFDNQYFSDENVTNLFKKITATHGKFAVLGEKDYQNISQSTLILEHGGFEVLSNQSRKIYYNNSALLLLGMETTGDLNSIISLSDSGFYKVVLVHQPDFFSQSMSNNINLQISGHSHGGYIYIPFLGSLKIREGAKIYNHGHYKNNVSDLIVSNGLGMEKENNIRLLCTPDIISITLKKQ